MRVPSLGSTLLSSAEARVINSNYYHCQARAIREIQVAKATNGQKNGSAEESSSTCCLPLQFLIIGTLVWAKSSSG